MFGARSGSWRQPEFDLRQPADEFGEREEEGSGRPSRIWKKNSQTKKKKDKMFFLDALNFNLSKNVEETKLPCQGRYQQKRKKSSPG